MGLMNFWITLLFGIVITTFGVSHFPTYNLWYFALTLVGLIMVLVAFVGIGGKECRKHDPSEQKEKD